MRMNVLKKEKSSFLSCEKDANLILERIFGTTNVFSKILKKLLIIQKDDVLIDTTNEEYDKIARSYDIPRLIQDGFVRFAPRLDIEQFQEAKSYIIINFDQFTKNKRNPQFRDNLIIFDIVCPSDSWDLQELKQRPLKIAGYIDNELDGARLTGIGKIEFVLMKRLVLNNKLSGYTLVYKTIHGSDDKLDRPEEVIIDNPEV